MTATDPIVYGINYHHDHQPEGATSNPGSVQARIDRALKGIPQSVTVFGRKFTAEGDVVAFWAAWTDEQRETYAKAREALGGQGEGLLATDDADYWTDDGEPTYPSAADEAEAESEADQAAAARSHLSLRFWQTANLWDHTV